MLRFRPKNAKSVKQKLKDLEARHFPSAIRNAQNDSVRHVWRVMRKYNKQVFKRPIKRTVNSTLYSTAQSKTPDPRTYLKSRVWLQHNSSKQYDPVPDAGNGYPVNYLSPQILGGSRSQKSLERRLSAKGLLGSREFLVPSIAYRAGHIPGFKPRQGHRGIDAAHTQIILSKLRAQGDPQQNTPPNPRNYKARKFAKANRIYWSDGRIRPKGIWFANRKDEWLVALAVDHVRYRAIYKFEPITTKVFIAHFRKRIQIETSKALAKIARGIR